LLLVWLMGVGALSTLLGAWIFVWIVSRERLGIDVLFGGGGFYTALAGAAGPCVLWLAGRAQGHSLAWFMVTAAKIALTMLLIISVVVMAAVLIMGGLVPTLGVVALGASMAVAAILLGQIWAVATWAADRWIARARVDDAGTEPS
jgi:hypothetical protein